uniref:Uncharacterized protein n=2 Tax=Triticum TaxID=4564 RepID=A0A8R7VAE8_TRIUA
TRKTYRRPSSASYRKKSDRKEKTNRRGTSGFSIAISLEALRGEISSDCSPDSSAKMPRIPMIRFPKRHLKVPSPPAAQPADQHATLMSRLGAKVEAPSSGEKKNYRFRSDVPSAPSHNAVGGPASQLPKRKPLSEEEIEAIMQGGVF